MIEVEKKFVLNSDQTKALLTGATFLVEKKIEDIYFDTLDYKLSIKDWWLRKRGDQFELKISVGNNATRTVDQYEELETDVQIRKALEMPEGKDLSIDLALAGYQVFCHCITTRKKYSHGEFTIDLDEVRYDNGSTYRIAEIELMVSEDQIGEADRRLREIADHYGLEDRIVRGKIIEYLFQNDQKHYRALKTAGVIRRKQD